MNRYIELPVAGRAGGERYERSSGPVARAIALGCDPRSA